MHLEFFESNYLIYNQQGQTLLSSSFFPVESKGYYSCRPNKEETFFFNKKNISNFSFANESITQFVELNRQSKALILLCDFEINNGDDETCEESL